MSGSKRDRGSQGHDHPQEAAAQKAPAAEACCRASCDASHDNNEPGKPRESQRHRANS